jgi:hypothetical protein
VAVIADPIRHFPGHILEEVIINRIQEGTWGNRGKLVMAISVNNMMILLKLETPDNEIKMNRDNKDNPTTHGLNTGKTSINTSHKTPNNNKLKTTTTLIINQEMLKEKNLNHRRDIKRRV